jgi:hypothetical protein
VCTLSPWLDALSHFYLTSAPSPPLTALILTRCSYLPAGRARTRDGRLPNYWLYELADNHGFHKYVRLPISLSHSPPITPSHHNARNRSKPLLSAISPADFLCTYSYTHFPRSPPSFQSFRRSSFLFPSFGNITRYPFLLSALFITALLAHHLRASRYLIIHTLHKHFYSTILTASFLITHFPNNFRTIRKGLGGTGGGGGGGGGGETYSKIIYYSFCSANLTSTEHSYLF